MKTTLLILSTLSTVILLSACSRPSPPVYSGQKMRGINLVAPSKEIDSSVFSPIRQVNAEWVAVIPYGFCREGEPHFHFNMNKMWWGETKDGTAKTIELAHQSGLKVMLKPHAWVGRGMYTGDFDLKTEADWQTFEKDFGDYILTNARIADSMKVDLFCIATEMDNFAFKRAPFWRSMIRQVREIYKGPLTYADNWNNYPRNPFWADLDFIGVDAYFPLSSEKHPSVETLQKGWLTHLDELEEFAAKLQKPILFTEFGYRSVDFATEKPWESHDTKTDNPNLQADAYRAFFKEVWPRKWLAGAFAWKWFLHQPPNRHRDAFSPQQKPAEAVLREEFGKK
ncbi:hypothetical protein DR864_04170 [Runella rosea]|uniref:Glycoside hydrolase n=1 Tax=Runella rosea TaxID=2259595 RepID=A0A344TEB3_9BACT|nr:hypothetical protein [Runella rosea]AXE16984.1 hypothetical protein DR864_04170 [Runella rosea]